VCLLPLTGTLSLCVPPDSCDLMTSAPCQSSYGPSGCYILDGPGHTFCVPAGTVLPGGLCQVDYQCAPGAMCHLSHCARWCRDDNGCTAPATCTGIGTETGHPDLGYCG
jgi:hypothetical protein